MKHCENCGTLHDETYGSGRFCSSSCSRAFSTKNKRTMINEKVSQKLKGRPGGNWANSYNLKKFGSPTVPLKTINCLNCGIERQIPINWNTKFCSKSCSSSYIQKQRSINGTHNGFPSRKDKKPSWAEQFVINIFITNGIQFKREYKINRFFADFAFPEQKIILEIDGHQHEERKKLDEIRDSIISNEGWKIVRIKWKHRDFNYMDEQIKVFIKSYLEDVV